MRAKVMRAILFSALLALALPTLGLALIGDLDINGVVDDPDMQVVSAAYGSHSSNPISANWNAQADIDQNDKVDLADLVIFGRNYGDDFNFYGPRRISNGIHGDPDLTRITGLDSGVDNRGNVHIVYQEGSPTTGDWVYYTQLDSAGNTLVEDLLLDTLASDPRLAVDAQGNVHIAWHAVYDASNSKSGVLYASLDSTGRLRAGPRVVCDRCLLPAIAVDGYGHAHIVARNLSMNLLYLALDGYGEPLLTPTRINTRFAITTSGIYPEIAIGPDGARHILWYEDTPGAAGDLIYTRIPLGDLPSPNQLSVVHISNWSGHRLGLQVDSLGAAHILWHDYRGSADTLGSVFWKRINPDGSLSAEVQVTNGGYHETPLVVSFSIDPQDRLHYTARSEDIEVGYGLLDRQGGVLIPYQTVYYHNCTHSSVEALPGGGAALLFSDYNGQYGVNPLMILSSVADPAAFDGLRPDLVLDQAHLAASALVTRIIDQVTFTVTLANGGWAQASGITLAFTETVAGTPIPAANLPDLPPFSSVTVTRTFDIPDLEDITALPIRIQASTTLPETTLANNTITLTLGVIPPAHSVDVSAAALDETYASGDRDLSAYLLGGTLTLEVPSLGYQAMVTSTHAINGFVGVPLDPNGGPAWNTLLRLTLAAPGYSSATQEVTAQRFANDPYRVLLTPAAPVPLYVNQWGTVQGMVFTGTTTTKSLVGATVILDGERSVLTDSTGGFKFTQVISGSHTLEAWHAGNAPFSIQVQVSTGNVAAVPILMPSTTRGYVRGVVTNDLGRPFTNITVNLKGDGSQIASAVSNDQGVFAFEVADVGAYTSYSLEATCSMCTPFASSPFTPIAGLPEIYDFTLSWSVTDADLQTSAEVTSWEQVERYNKLDEDNLSIGELILYHLADSINELDSYEVDVWWAKYHYSLGLNYNETGGTYTLQNLSVDLANYSMYSYDVQGGDYHGGVQDVDRSALRVDRVDLVQIDANNNVIGAALWEDETQWYASDPQGVPAWDIYNIAASPSDWSNAAVRIFVRVGQYTSDASTSHWKPWQPPVAVASLTGSGSAAGSDYQVIIWRLSSNSVEVLKSMAYYADVVGTNADPQDLSTQAQPLAVADPQALTVSLQFPAAPPARIGAPFAVDVVVSGAVASPVFALELDLNFDPAYLQVLRVEGGAGFQSAHGPAWVVAPSLAQANATGQLNGMAVVRLGSVGGIGEGVVARVYFMPLALTSQTPLKLSRVLLASQAALSFAADLVGPTLNLEIDLARLFLPLAVR